MAKYAANGATVTINTHGSDDALYSSDNAESISNVVSFGVPSDSSDEIDVSDHSSNRREYVNGLIDSDDMTIELVYDPADTGQGYLRDYVGSTEKEFVITLSGPAASNTHTFNALVKSFSIDLPADGAITATATIKRVGVDQLTTV